MWLDMTLLSACSAFPTFLLAIALKPQLKTRLSRALGLRAVTPRHCQLATRGSCQGGSTGIQSLPSFARNRATVGSEVRPVWGMFMKPGLLFFNPACEKPCCLLAFPPCALMPGAEGI